MAKPKKGTEPKDPSQTTFTFRVATEEIARWRAAAKEEDVPLSNWIRRACKAAVVAKR